MRWNKNCIEKCKTFPVKISANHIFSSCFSNMNDADLPICNKKSLNINYVMGKDVNGERVFQSRLKCRLNKRTLEANHVTLPVLTIDQKFDVIVVN